MDFKIGFLKTNTFTNVKLCDVTPAEEDYLKAIYHLDIKDNRMVSTNAIAKRMATKPASVTDMVKKLAKKELIDHRMYRGVRLTEKGRSAALSVIRKQRLWEVFLVQKLNFSLDYVSKIAEALQHVQSKTLIDKLDSHLGFPQVAPSGEAIPSKDGAIKKRIEKLLSDLPVGAAGVCTAFKDSSPAFLKFLDKNQIAIGSSIRILDKEEFDGSFGLQIDTREIRISQQIASNLYLEVGENTPF